MNTKYGFGKSVATPFAETVARVTKALSDEGFGILTDIDVAATMKAKLNEAHRAIKAEPSIGLLLPCNVVVREDDAGSVRVEFMDTDAVLDLVGKPEIDALATEVRRRLDRVMAAV